MTDDALVLAKGTLGGLLTDNESVFRELFVEALWDCAVQVEVEGISWYYQAEEEDKRQKPQQPYL